MDWHVWIEGVSAASALLAALVSFLCVRASRDWPSREELVEETTEELATAFQDAEQSMRDLLHEGEALGKRLSAVRSRLSATGKPAGSNGHSDPLEAAKAEADKQVGAWLQES